MTVMLRVSTFFYRPQGGIKQRKLQKWLFVSLCVMQEKAMANYSQEHAQDAVCQSHTGHMTGLCFLPSPVFKAEY